MRKTLVVLVSLAMLFSVVPVAMVASKMFRSQPIGRMTTSHCYIIPGCLKATPMTPLKAKIRHPLRNGRVDR